MNRAELDFEAVPEREPMPEGAASSVPWLMDLSIYDRNPELTPLEHAALTEVESRRHVGRPARGWPAHIRRTLRRLHMPVHDVLARTGCGPRAFTSVNSLLAQAMLARGNTFWGWTRQEWLALLRQDTQGYQQHLLVVAYLLSGQWDLHLELRGLLRDRLAIKVFGNMPFEMAVGQIHTEVRHWGYADWLTEGQLPNAVAALLLVSGSPKLEDITPGVVGIVSTASLSGHFTIAVRLVGRALVKLGLLPASTLVPERPNEDLTLGSGVASDVPDEWGRWCERWHATSTITAKARRIARYYLFRAGRWLAAAHPEVTSPAQWTRELAAEYVATVDRLTVGQWLRAPVRRAPEGTPLSAATKDKHLEAMRVFFRDGQEWGWFPRRFDPRRAFATPPSVKALIGPKPRVIADDVWAKLLWAGLNLTEDDLPALYRSKGTPYPLAMVRALVVAWLFTGLRNDELRRLRVGCIRWQSDNVVLSGTAEDLPKDAICWLDVPVNKTSTAFTKAVDRVVGEAIEAWERVRPTQLPAVDAKTQEVVQYLFSYRGRRIGDGYLNDRVIPLLCHKASVPQADARGNLTSHRARSTIASQLANAKEPMSLLELMAWLGHRNPDTTRRYVMVTPTRLAKAYADAGYFARNLRAVEVLIDQEVVESGAATRGEPWRFYDLGHGYCTYKFFDQCPHRMACARCSFYRPKGSSEAQLLEGKANLLRMRQELPLLEEERAAVDDGIEALERLLARLADFPTPDSGPTPRERNLQPLPMLPSLAKPG